MEDLKNGGIADTMTGSERPARIIETSADIPFSGPFLTNFIILHFYYVIH